MNYKQAELVADLLNTHNQLVVQYDAGRVLRNADNYLCEFSASGDVIASAELKRVQWYQFEIDHVTVAPGHLRQGKAMALLTEAVKKATAAGGRILQCTIRENNRASQGLFRRMEFSMVSRFHYPESGNNVQVWQRVLSPPR